jgi:hypothetical protein
LVKLGLNLTEPDFIDGKPTAPGLDYDNKDFYHNRLNVKFPPEINRLKESLGKQSSTSQEKTE